MRKIIILLLSFYLFGCATGQGGMFGAGKFEVMEADSRFSESNDRIFTSKNNRISSKSIAGGVHIDGRGVFVNPMMTKSADSHKVLLLGLSIENMTSHDTSYGSPNTLGTIQSIAFLIDNQEPIVLEAHSSSTEWSDVIDYNSVTRSASSDIVESGMVALSAEEYEKIISSQSLAVKVQGSKRSVVYESEDISDSFVQNLQQFYNSYVL